MERNKSGISLIVLVITIIVMIILAGAVIISLGNAGIIGKSQEAVDANNLKQVEQLAALAWSEAYIDIMEEELTEAEKLARLKTAVDEALEENDVNKDLYDIDVTTSGVSVKKKVNTTLGALITGAADYGKTVDYTVTVDGTSYNNWQVYYANEEYVYIIAGESVGDTTLDKGTTVASLTVEEKALYEKFRVGSAAKYTLVDTVYGNTAYNCQAVAQLIKDYAGFGATTESYATYVEGAIGGPTIELLAAGWNAKGYEPTLEITYGDFGYFYFNGEYSEYSVSVTSDGLYVPSDYYFWLASPCGSDNFCLWGAGRGSAGDTSYGSASGVRPVVCLSADIPAVAGTTTDFSLVK